MILTGIDTGGVRRVPPVQLPRDWIVPLEHPKGESGKRQNCQQPGLPGDLSASNRAEIVQTILSISG